MEELFSGVEPPTNYDNSEFIAINDRADYLTVDWLTPYVCN